MLKKTIYFLLICLLLSFLGGCGKNSDDIAETTEEDIRVSAPTGVATDALTDAPELDTTVEVTEEITEADTTRPDYPSDIIIETQPTFIPGETVEITPDTDASPDTDVAPDTDEALVIPTPEVVTEAVELGESFLAGEPATGTLVSKQSEKIRLAVNYNIQMNLDGSVTADFQIGLESYDINCGARADAGRIIVNGVSSVFSTEAIVHEEREMIFIPFAAYTYQLDSGETSIDLDASWIFNGSYAGEDIDALAVDASFTWDAPIVEDTAE